MDAPLSRQQLAAIREDYMLHSLSEEDCGADPIVFFEHWLQQAITAQVDEPTAMVLSTANGRGGCSSRVVLLKGLEQNRFVFFTNYQSNKALELETNPQASLLFFWPKLQRQVRVEGSVERTNENLSDEYFQSRPRGSQLGAWASPQSRVISSRQLLEVQLEKVVQQFQNIEVTRPGFWGGYILQPQRIEFWQGRASRLHDRILFEHTNAKWEKSRLAP